jgi:hypothetical protein
MATSKLGFIFEQTAESATCERWFHEFLLENPPLLDEVGCVRLRPGEEPTLCFSAKAIKGFLNWCLQQGYGTQSRFSPSLTSLRKCTDGGMHERGATGGDPLARGFPAVAGPQLR